MNLLLFYGQMPDSPAGADRRRAVTSRVVPTPVYATTSTSGGTLTKLADEGGSFTVTGSGTVRYGVGTTFIEMTVSGAGQCNNTFFGNDPAVGSGKACYLFVPTPAPPPRPPPRRRSPPTRAPSTARWAGPRLPRDLPVAGRARLPDPEVTRTSP